MRTVIVWLTAASLCVGTAIAQETRSLPVSLARIRAALEKAADPPLDLDRRPVFRVDVVERAAPDLFRRSMPIGNDPVPPGGLYAYEQRRQIGPNLPQPLVSISLLPIFDALGSAIGGARRARAVDQSRRDVTQALAEYCAAQPDRGARLQICAISPATR